MTDPSEIADRLLAVFRELPNRPILGSTLGLQIKTHFPDFSPLAYQCRSLRHFLAAHVPQIVETGRRGQDVEYSLKPLGPDAVGCTVENAFSNSTEILSSSVPPIRHDLWKTFVSPGGTYRMYVDPNTHAFQVLHSGQPAPAAPWVQVPPCPTEVHINIAREFLQQVSDPAHRRELERVLGSGVWWVEFLRTAELMGLGKDWVKFRRTRLQQQFERALSAIGVPVSAAAGTWQTTPLRAPRRTYGTHSLQDDDLRDTLQRVIGRLSREELRRLWLPVGVLIDEVQYK